MRHSIQKEILTRFLRDTQSTEREILTVMVLSDSYKIQNIHKKGPTKTLYSIPNLFSQSLHGCSTLHNEKAPWIFREQHGHRNHAVHGQLILSQLPLLCFCNRQRNLACHCSLGSSHTPRCTGARLLLWHLCGTESRCPNCKATESVCEFGGKAALQAACA